MHIFRTAFPLPSSSSGAANYNKLNFRNLLFGLEAGDYAFFNGQAPSTSLSFRFFFFAQHAVSFHSCQSLFNGQWSGVKSVGQKQILNTWKAANKFIICFGPRFIIGSASAEILITFSVFIVVFFLFLMFLFCNFCLRFWQLGHNWLIINGEQGARSRKNKNYFSFSPWIFWHQHSGWWRARKCQINEAKDKSKNGKCIIMNKLLAISSREKREEKLESRVTENGSEIQCQSLWVALNLIRQWVFKMH